jgi:Fur family ferric uptake transcriptional regulator
MISPMAPTVDQMLSALRRRGHRLTGQRRAILDGVASSGGHISADAVHRAVSAAHPTVDRSTVYRTLALLERLGFLVHHHDATGIAYHHAEDRGHVHLACLACDHVDALRDLSLADEFVRKLEQQQGFRANLSHSTIFGVCGPCAEAGHSPTIHHRHPTPE